MDKLKIIYPAKAQARTAIINADIGFIERFKKFLDDYMNTQLVVPISAVTADPNAPDGLGSKLGKLSEKNSQLRTKLDQRDAQLVQAIQDSWNANAKAVTSLASKSGSMLKRVETSGASMLNQEMNTMFSLAKTKAKDNDKDIQRLAKMAMIQANSEAREISKKAAGLVKGSQDTLTKANDSLKTMSDIQATLDLAKAASAAIYGQIEKEVTDAGAAKFLAAQGKINEANQVASSKVDDSLKRIASDVAKALSQLTDQETYNVTSISDSASRQLDVIGKAINKYIGDADTGAKQVQLQYQGQITAAANTGNTIFSSIDQSMSDINNEVTAANTSYYSLKSQLGTTFSGLDADVSALFTALSEKAKTSKASLDKRMDTALSAFKVYALNKTRDNSDELKNAFNAALQAVTTGSGALSLTFEQRQAIIGQLQNWQSSYRGNTDKMVSAFQSTYTGLVQDTSGQLSAAVSEEKGRIEAAKAAQSKMVQDAIAAAQGDPAKLNQLLAKFGIIGDKATAAAAQLKAELEAAGGSLGGGIGDGMMALNALKAAADATSDAYKAAATKNTEASKVANDAVKDVTTRIAGMNELMKQYSGDLSKLLFDANAQAQSDINNSTSTQNAAVASQINAKMSEVQKKLGEVLASGQTNMDDLNAFAAKIGANAENLKTLVGALQGNNVDYLSEVTNIKKEALEQLSSTVKAQVDATTVSFQDDLSKEKSSMSHLVDAMKEDLTTQSGAKSKVLVQQRDQLQALYAELASSKFDRDRAIQNLDSTFTSAEGKVSTGLPDMTAKFNAEKAKVDKALVDTKAAFMDAWSTVNGTIGSTNATGQHELDVLRAAGQDKVNSVKDALGDSSSTVSNMVKRYQEVMSKYLNADREARIKQNADELSKVIDINAALTDSQKAQQAALEQRSAQSKTRAAALAATMGDLTGAQQAAGSGQDTFRAYVQALAQKSRVDMADLVNAMKTQVTDKKSGLYKLLNDNKLFVSGTLDELSADAALVQKGVVDSSSASLTAIQSAASRANTLGSNQAAALKSVNGTSSQVRSLTGAQLTELMTILLAKADLHSQIAASGQNAALQRMASVADATAISSDAMNEATTATRDALQLASKETEDLDVKTGTMIKDTVSAAITEADKYVEAGSNDYNGIVNSLNSAKDFMSVFKTRLDRVTDNWNSAKPEIEGDVSKLRGDIDSLKTQVANDKNSILDRVNAFTSAAQSASLTKLSDMQKRMR